MTRVFPSLSEEEFGLAVADDLDAAALDVVLETIAAPAFVVASYSIIVRANAAGRALMKSQGDKLGDRIADAIAKRKGADFEARKITLRSRGTFHFVISDDPYAHRQRILDAAAEAWDLTRKQRAVLELVAEGLCNKLAADKAQCAQSTIELHVTTLLRKSGSSSRSELISKLLLQGHRRPRAGRRRALL